MHLRPDTIYRKLKASSLTLLGNVECAIMFFFFFLLMERSFLSNESLANRYIANFLIRKGEYCHPCWSANLCTIYALCHPWLALSYFKQGCRVHVQYKTFTFQYLEVSASLGKTDLPSNGIRFLALPWASLSCGWVEVVMLCFYFSVRCILPVPDHVFCLLTAPTGAKQSTVFIQNKFACGWLCFY